ncbi:MAG: Carboxylesterase type, partial [Acidimicrobiales bacterium]|nr:Carboxylesterase type [Acidimicrobiales bacterium]
VEPRDASAFGASAPQHLSALEASMGADAIEWDEDCLYLNVWTPACDGARRPVMVWLHGGSYVFGSGSTPWYDGARLAARDAVIVTVNYRLGAFGYLYLDELAPGFEGSGNAGLLDQVAALRWVRDNIAGFGGDPTNVTLFGESAGAMSVGTLLATPSAAGLFRRAILESGAASHVHEPQDAVDVAEQILAAAGTDAAGVRDLPAAELLAAGAVVLERAGADGLTFQPVVDGLTLPEKPLDRLRSGAAADVDVLIGTNADEMTMFLLLGLDSLEARANVLFEPAGYAPGEALRVYRQRLAEVPDDQVWCAVLSDHTFRIPALRLAEVQVDQGGSAWVYLFTYPTPAFGGLLRSAHALEIPFVFDNLDAQGVWRFVGEITPAHRALASAMADAWVAFARDGLPAAPGLPDWPAYDLEQRPTMRFDIDACVVVDDPWGAERALWDGIQ